MEATSACYVRADGRIQGPALQELRCTTLLAGFEEKIVWGYKSPSELLITLSGLSYPQPSFAPAATYKLSDHALRSSQPDRPRALAE